MDKSKKYILMCEKAPKELWDKVEHYGSLIAWRSFIGIIIPDPDKRKLEGLASVIPETLVLRTWLKEGKKKLIILETDIDYGGLNGDKGTPLYRQDQLQEIAFGKFDNPIFVIQKFTKFHADWLWIDFTSLEQLWLGYIMKEKYSKMWDGKDWIKQ